VPSFEAQRSPAPERANRGCSEAKAVIDRSSVLRVACPAGRSDCSALYPLAHRVVVVSPLLMRSPSALASTVFMSSLLDLAPPPSAFLPAGYTERSVRRPGGEQSSFPLARVIRRVVLDERSMSVCLLLGV